MPVFGIDFAFELNLGRPQPLAHNNDANNNAPNGAGDGDGNQNPDQPNNNANAPDQSNDNNQNHGEEPNSSNAPDSDQSTDNQDKEEEESGNQQSPDSDKGKTADGKQTDAESDNNNNNDNSNQPDNDDKPPDNANPDAADDTKKLSPDNDEIGPVDSPNQSVSQNNLEAASVAAPSGQGGQPSTSSCLTLTTPIKGSQGGKPWFFGMFGRSQRSSATTAPDQRPDQTSQGLHDPQAQKRSFVDSDPLSDLNEGAPSDAKISKLNPELTPNGTLHHDAVGKDSGDSTASGAGPSDAALPNRGFHVSDADMSTWPTANQLDEQIKRGNYIVHDFQITHRKYGKVEFLGAVDLSSFGGFINICNYVTFGHGLVHLNVPHTFRMPAFRLSFEGITRNDFSQAFGLGTGSDQQQIADDQLKMAVNILATKAGAVDKEYHEDIRQWRMLILP